MVQRGHCPHRSELISRKVKIVFFICSFGKSRLSCIPNVVSFLLTLSEETGTEDERINSPALSCRCASGKGRLNQERSVTVVEWHFEIPRIGGMEKTHFHFFSGIMTKSEM